MSFVLPILFGITHGIAWCSTNVYLRLALTFISVIGWVLVISKSKRPCLSSYLVATTAHVIGFSWLYGTIRNFGGFPIIPSGLIFLLYILSAGISHACIPLFIKVLYRHLGKTVAFALAWIAAEQFPLRIFPWSIAHLTAETPLALLSSIGGVPLVTLLMIVAASLYVDRRFKPLVGTLIVWIGVSTLLEKNLTTQSDRKISVAAVQGNISLVRKHDIQYFDQNVTTYTDLTQELQHAPQPLDLVVWPESVLTGGVPLQLKDRKELTRVYHVPASGNILMGALTFASEKEVYNSAIGLQASGEITNPYHKRILMPFGEYTPLGDTFPWLRSINATAGDFYRGVRSAPINFDNGIKAGTLICYEDIVPSLSHQAVIQGANLLATLSNDAWFGDTAEPYQHNLIASFRAIEQGRYLVRASNTGLTNVVSPLGKTLSSITPYTVGAITQDIYLLDHQTIFNKIGDSPWQVLSAIIYLSTLIVGVKYLWSKKHSS